MDVSIELTKIEEDEFDDDDDDEENVDAGPERMGKREEFTAEDLAALAQCAVGSMNKLVYTSIYLCVYVSMCLCDCRSMYPFICVCIDASVYISMRPCINVSI